MQHRDFLIDLDDLQIEANDEELSAVIEDHEVDDLANYKTKHFHIKFDAESSHIIELYTKYAILMSGKLSEYDNNCTIVDDGNGDVYTLEELFLVIFEG